MRSPIRAVKNRTNRYRVDPRFRRNVVLCITYLVSLTIYVGVLAWSYGISVFAIAIGALGALVFVMTLAVIVYVPRTDWQKRYYSHLGSYSLYCYVATPPLSGIGMLTPGERP